MILSILPLVSRSFDTEHIHRSSYTSTAKQMRRTMVKLLWNGSAGLFADGLNVTHHAVHSSIIAAASEARTEQHNNLVYTVKPLTDKEMGVNVFIRLTILRAGGDGRRDGHRIACSPQASRIV